MSGSNSYVPAYPCMACMQECKKMETYIKEFWISIQHVVWISTDSTDCMAKARANLICWILGVDPYCHCVIKKSKNYWLQIVSVLCFSLSKQDPTHKPFIIYCAVLKYAAISVYLCVTLSACLSFPYCVVSTLVMVNATLTMIMARCYFPSLWTDKCKAQALFSVHGGQKTRKSGITELFSSHVEA